MPTVEFTYKGLIAPVFTPFKNDPGRSVNFSIIPEYAQFLASRSVNGVLVNGTSGEGTSLSIDERKKVTEAWSAAVKKTKQHLMIQIGGAVLKDVKDLAAHAEKLGANSLLCLPELYFKPATVVDLIGYLRIVGESAPNTPLLYYHIPRVSMVNLNMGEFFKMVSEKIPTFAGMKFTSNDLEEAHDAMTANNRLAIFLGSDTLMSAGCTVGINSFIMTSLNFIPEPALEILEFGKCVKDLENARKNQEYITKIVKEITRYGSWVETMKVAMTLTTSLFMGPPRAPLKILSVESVKAMAEGLKKINLKTDVTNYCALLETYKFLHS